MSVYLSLETFPFVFHPRRNDVFARDRWDEREKMSLSEGKKKNEAADPWMSMFLQ